MNFTTAITCNQIRSYIEHLKSFRDQYVEGSESYKYYDEAMKIIQVMLDTLSAQIMH